MTRALQKNWSKTNYMPIRKKHYHRYRTYLTIEVDILARNMHEAKAIEQNLDFGNLRNSAGEEVEWGITEKVEKLRRISHG